MSLTFIFLLLQLLIGIHFIFPVLLFVLSSIRKEKQFSEAPEHEVDYAIIITAFEQTELVPSAVESVLNMNYSNYLVYVVADNCDISNLNFLDPRIFVLKPDEVLASNVKSHLYAIENFRRAHKRITIIDSDNLVESEYLKELNCFFDNGFSAVQGVRRAKKLNSQYACLDEAGDMYYRFVDRRLLFLAGSSSSLAGSGMAFSTDLYVSCLTNCNISGAGFDKVLQFEILKSGHRIAFAEKAIVFDEKTSQSGQLVKQRARWINSWFRFSVLGVNLLIKGFSKFERNSILFSLMLLRPPLFILFTVSIILSVLNLIFLPAAILIWICSALIFAATFFIALCHFRASKLIYNALWSYPKFFYFQIVALTKAKIANQISVATKHEVNS